MVDLAKVFKVYSTQNGMDIRGFIKSMKESGLLDGRFTKVDADLAFCKHTAHSRHTRKIGLEDFEQILRCIARRRSVSDQEVFEQAAAGATTASTQCTRSEEKWSSRPERFFYDTTTYTGVHRRGRGDVEHTKPPCVRTAARSASPRGPERFFYDKSTYTGTHRNGGPTASGNGLPKEGFKDLSEVGLRADVSKEFRRRAQSARPERRESAESLREVSGLEQAAPAQVLCASLPVLLGQNSRQSAPEKTLSNSRGKHQKGSRAAALIGTRFIPVSPVVPSSLDLSVGSIPSSLLEMSD